MKMFDTYCNSLCQSHSYYISIEALLTITYTYLMKQNSEKYMFQYQLTLSATDPNQEGTNSGLK